MESIKCAITLRGFDPIIVKSEREYKNVKYRKMALKTLISECFEELNGPVFIMLPVSVSLLKSLIPETHIALPVNLSYDLYDNEITYLRSLVGFTVKTDDRVGKKE